MSVANDFAQEVRQCCPPNDLRPLYRPDASAELSQEAQAPPSFNKEFSEVLQAPYLYSCPIRFVPDGAL